MADLAKEWRALLEAEYASRQTQRDWDAGANQRVAAELLNKLSLMTDRLAAPENAKLAAALAAAPDQAAIDALRRQNDLSPAETVALLMLVQGGGAERLLRRYAAQQNTQP